MNKIESEIIDSTDNKNQILLSAAIAWWEKKRVLFNLFVGLTGVFAMTLVITTFGIIDLIDLIFYGIAANIFYCLGFVLEALNLHYLKGKFKIDNYRLFLFIVGTTFSCIVTFLGCIIFYTIQFP
ncbi:hypothetical protein [Crocinitomix catalasitica]|uniref:hypothetical protein n=1 Tax=Crocinitomix catalasitica TaxID=184607 RepID=UPI0006879BFB|nr:hypothetical protein [Crocinitomix catalasitica]